jgi:uncharacterized membrane protein YoaT (DUF817 family)
VLLPDQAEPWEHDAIGAGIGWALVVIIVVAVVIIVKTLGG